MPFIWIRWTSCSQVFVCGTTSTWWTLSLIHMHGRIFCGKFFSNHFYLLVYMRIKICPNFMWQIHLLKSWRASFYLAKNPPKMSYAKVCPCAPPVPQNLPCTSVFRGWQRLLRFCLYRPWPFLAHRPTSFQHSICCLYTRAKIRIKLTSPRSEESPVSPFLNVSVSSKC